MVTVDPRFQYGRPLEEVIARYKALYSGAVYDALEEAGCPNQALASDLEPLRSDMILAGPAFTVKGIPDRTARTDMLKRRMHMFLDMRALGCPLIDVRDCSFDTTVAHYGEMNATVGRSSGATGALIDGGCRDSGFLLRADFPTFCRYQTPVEAFRRWSYHEWQIRIGLRGALTDVVTIEPGDFIFGDLDGVLVIPHDGVLDTLERAERLAVTEDASRAEFSSGADPIAVYERYGRL